LKKINKMGKISKKTLAKFFRKYYNRKCKIFTVEKIRRRKT